ncbi:MAG: hypothetical protein ACFFCV_05930 [Promethearchaeota archaeon]
MKTQEYKEKETKSINLILLAISLIIFGTLGIVFITQMELHPGWIWQDEIEKNSAQFYGVEADDITGDGINDIITYADIDHLNPDLSSQYNIPQYGAVFALNGINGREIWSKPYSGPVQRLFPIMDVDSDGFQDYFVNIASVTPNWSEYNQIEIIPNAFTNEIVSGLEGADPSVSHGVSENFTGAFVADLVSFEDIDDNYEDLICLEVEYNETLDRWFWNISSYFINGTKTYSINVDDTWVQFSGQLDIPGIEIFPYQGEPHLLYIGGHTIRLLNLSSSNFLNYTYNELINTIDGPLSYKVIEDLNSDGIPEILIATSDENCLLINGINGTEIRRFTIPYELTDSRLTEIPNPDGDGETYFAIESYVHTGDGHNDVIIEIYSLTLGTQNLLWDFISTARTRSNLLILDEDLNGDSINEIVYLERIETAEMFEDIARYRIFSFATEEVLAIINLQYESETMINIGDIDNNGRKDFLVCEEARVMALSTTKPVGIWLSSGFRFGFPLFIILAGMLGGGIIILIIKSKDLRMSRKEIRESIRQTKLTVIINVIVLILMTLAFILFLFQLNIFNNTLIAHHQMTDLIITFITVTILWYAILPLTAAIYNQFSPRFAFFFIRLRNLFFKVSKSYNHDIMVLDMKDKTRVGIVIQIKRTILPLLLSIAIGFYIYNLFAPLLGYSQGFTQFSSPQFFSFIIGYMLLCLFPTILSYPLFAFFISGNFLLDDAGIVYFRESKKYRQPGDIEPISIWAQSLVKGIAGLSALITFGNFFLTVDFSGFFTGNPLFVIFGTLMVIVMFWGAPFLTGFSYILLAGQVMQYSIENNSQKLYKKMKKKGYDTSPRDIMNIYHSGFEASRSMKNEKKDENH